MMNCLTYYQYFQKYEKVSITFKTVVFDGLLGHC